MSEDSTADTYHDPVELFTEVGRMILRGETPVSGVEERSFVLVEKYGNRAFVGFREDGDTFVVGELSKRTERMGQHDYKIKEQDNEYIRCDLYRMEVNEPVDSDETIQTISDRIDNQRYEENLDTGYINAWMQPATLDNVLKDVFKWY